MSNHIKYKGIIAESKHRWGYLR